jgi:hypothetical protein
MKTLRPETVENIRRQPDVAYNRTLVIPEAEGTKLITVLHRDGTATVIRIEPFHDGIELHVELGPDKVMHDVKFHRNGADADDDG